MSIVQDDIVNVNTARIMFKWHVHSAIGRGRPVAHDFARVADGIAASLRAFSVSARRAAEDRMYMLFLQIVTLVDIWNCAVLIYIIENDAPIRPRTQKATETLDEISSLQPAPARGVDARSLAARPAAELKITRQMVASPAPRGNFRSGGDRGPFRSGPRGGMRGGPRGGLGARGRGGAARGRGRGRGDGRRKTARGGAKKQSSDEDWEQPPMTEEELEYQELSDGGFTVEYNPTTSLEDLAAWGPPTMSSERGIKESLINRFSTAANTATVPGGFKYADEHLMNASRSGMAMFENAEERKKAQEWWAKNEELDPARTPDHVEKGAGVAHHFLHMMGVRHMASKELGVLSKQDQEDIMKQWVAGQHHAPKSMEKGDILSAVQRQTRRNGTYLQADMEGFEKKLKQLLPANMQEPKKPVKIQAPL